MLLAYTRARAHALTHSLAHSHTHFGLLASLGWCSRLPLDAPQQESLKKLDSLKEYVVLHTYTRTHALTRLNSHTLVCWLWRALRSSMPLRSMLLASRARTHSLSLSYSRLWLSNFGPRFATPLPLCAVKCIQTTTCTCMHTHTPRMRLAEQCSR